MSVVSFVLLLLLLLLSTSFHACNARAFSPVKTENTQEFDHSTTKGKKKSTTKTRVSDQTFTKSSPSSRTSSGGTQKKMSESKNSERSATEMEPSASVSWRVPHDKRRPGEAEPGFNLDYLPPKTHTPVHN